MQENVDILAFLEEVMRANTKFYQEDFQYDIKTDSGGIRTGQRRSLFSLDVSSLWNMVPE